MMKKCISGRMALLGKPMMGVARDASRRMSTYTKLWRPRAVLHGDNGSGCLDR